MTNVGRRLDRLEELFRCGNQPGPGWGLALDQNTCMQILGECGFLPMGVAVSMVDFCEVADGLNAQQTERFLGEHGAELCSPPATRKMPQAVKRMVRLHRSWREGWN